jgi:lipopolysaccharide/colanic/teichoic acid biosynthesis glycosyltransferase
VINVLRGELSVVGPRPEQPRYVASLMAKFPAYGVRHGVLPGITGWAQVKYGYAGDERGALQKLEYDLYYVRHRSLRLDLRILARTTRQVLGHGGR